MARCGSCAEAAPSNCGCYWSAGEGVEVTGAGTIADPFVLTAVNYQIMTAAQRLALAGGDLFDGLLVAETDTDAIWRYTGSVWRIVTPREATQLLSAPAATYNSGDTIIASTAVANPFGNAQPYRVWAHVSVLNDNGADLDIWDVAVEMPAGTPRWAARESCNGAYCHNTVSGFTDRTDGLATTIKATVARVTGTGTYRVPSDARFNYVQLQFEPIN